MKLIIKLSIAVIIAIALCISLITVGLINYFSVDRTAQPSAEKSFIIKGEKYVSIPIGFTEEGRTIAKADSFDIMELPEDKEHNFLAVRSFLDDWTIVRESYVIPTYGTVSVAYLRRERVTVGVKWDMVQSILHNDFSSEFLVKSDNIQDIASATSSIYVGYEDCPVGTELIGYFGNINGKLVFIKAEDIRDNDTVYTCYILKEKYQSLYKNDPNKNFTVINI